MEGAKLPIHELQQLLASMASIIKDNTARLEGIAATVDRIIASPFDLTSSRGMAEARAEAATSPTTTPDVATTTTSTKLVAASLVCSIDPHDVAPPSRSHTAAPIHTSELNVDLSTKCATTGIDHDLGRNLAAVTPPCTGCVSAAPRGAPPTPARQPAVVFERDKRTTTRCSMWGSGADAFDANVALSLFTVPKLDAPAHTRYSTKCSDMQLHTFTLRETRSIQYKGEALRPVPWPSFINDTGDFQLRSPWPPFRGVSTDKPPTDSVMNLFPWHNSYDLTEISGATKVLDALIMEMNHASCYDMIEQYCDLLGKQLNSLQKQRDCPQESMEAVSTLIFATARFPDLPELCDLRHILTERYGGSLEPFVSLEFIRKLETELFTNDEKFQVMQSIAEGSLVGFDMRVLESLLWAVRETEDDLLEKDSMKKGELAVPLPIKQKDDGQLNDNTGRNNSDKSHGKEQLEKSVSPLDFKRENAKKDDNTRRRHADKANGKEHLEKSVSPLQTEREETEKQVQKVKKKDARPSEKELMEAVELDINDLPKQGSGSVKLPETESNRIVPPIVKPKEAKKEHGVEKENDKGLGYHHRSPMPGRPDSSRTHANLGCKALGLQNQGPTSLNPSSGKTTNMPPPYSKPNGAKGKNCDEKEESNGCLRGRPQHLEDLGHTLQNGQRAPQRVANMQPPYVKPKLDMQLVNDDPAKPTGTNCSRTEKTNHLADKDVLRPVSVRRKPAAPDYDEAANDEKVTSQKASSHRTQPSKHMGASDATMKGTNELWSLSADCQLVRVDVLQGTGHVAVNCSPFGRGWYHPMHSAQIQFSYLLLVLHLVQGTAQVSLEKDKAAYSGGSLALGNFECRHTCRYGQKFQSSVWKCIRHASAEKRSR